MTRTRELHSRDLIPGRDLKEAEAARQGSSRAQLALADAQVAEQQAALQQTRYFGWLFLKLVAPLSGVVTRTAPESGADVQTSTPIFSVGALEPLTVLIEIPRRILALSVTARQLEFMPMRCRIVSSKARSPFCSLS